MFVDEGDLDNPTLLGDFHAALPNHLLPIIQVVSLGGGQRRDPEDGHSLALVAEDQLGRFHTLNINNGLSTNYSIKMLICSRSMNAGNGPTPGPTDRFDAAWLLIPCFSFWTIPHDGESAWAAASSAAASVDREPKHSASIFIFMGPSSKVEASILNISFFTVGLAGPAGRVHPLSIQVINRIPVRFPSLVFVGSFGETSLERVQVERVELDRSQERLRVITTIIAQSSPRVALRGGVPQYLLRRRPVPRLESQHRIDHLR